MQDFEKPYSDQCKREERFKQIVDAKRQEIWEALEDEVQGATFIYNHIANSDDLLADIMREVAKARKTLLGAAKSGDSGTGGKALADLYRVIEGYIDEHVEEAADTLAQRIFS